jgi:U3 small nucleolar ribonucleoprotein protein IMP4
MFFSVYCLKLGTLDNIEAAETEWVLRPYMNTSKKRQFLSIDHDEEDGGAK